MSSHIILIFSSFCEKKGAINFLVVHSLRAEILTKLKFSGFYNAIEVTELIRPQTIVKLQLNWINICKNFEFIHILKLFCEFTKKNTILRQ